jgi:hypothetical protein
MRGGKKYCPQCLNKVWLLVLILFLYASCNNSASKSKSTNSRTGSTGRKPGLSHFLSKFRLLPAENLRLEFIMSDTNYVPLHEATDTLFTGYGFAYGMLNDTSRFYGLLWYSSGADMPGLKLTTFNKLGEKMDEQWLTKDFPGDDCGHEWYGYVFIKPDMTILMRDSIVTYDCDNGIPPRSTWKHQLDSTDAKVRTNGEIEFSKTRQTQID